MGGLATPFVSVCSFTRYHWCSFWPKCSADSTSFRETFVLLVCVVTPTEGPGSRVVTPVLHEATARAISALKLRKLESVGRIIRRGRVRSCGNGETPRREGALFHARSARLES